MLTIRQKKIIRLLEDLGGSATIDNLMTKLYISKSTLRRDLISLEKNKCCATFSRRRGLGGKRSYRVAYK